MVIEKERIMQNLFTPSRHLYSIIIIFSVLFTSILFLGCPLDNGNSNEGTNETNNNGSVSVTNVQLYQHQNIGTTLLYTGNGTIKMGYFVGNGGIEYESIGTVSNGKLTFNLPDTVLDKYLDMASVMFPSSLVISPPDIKGIDGIALALFDGSVKKGYINFFRDLQNDSTYTVDAIYYMYFNKAGSINGTYSDDDESKTYQITAKAGWNKVYNKHDDNGTILNEIITTDLSGVPNDMKWILQLY
jgi:hypothetical protein